MIRRRRARAARPAAIIVLAAGTTLSTGAAAADLREYDGVRAASTPDEESAGPEVVAPAEEKTEADAAASKATPPPSSSAPPKKKKVNVRIPAIKSKKSGAVTQPWIRNTLFTEYYRENYNPENSDDGFVSLVNRTNVGTDTRVKNVTIGAQIRVDGQKIWFPDGQDCGAGGNCVPVDDDVRLERTTLRVDSKYVSAYVGDYNANLGRGLGLSVRKIDEIGVDATIKGARVDVRTKPIRVTGFAGFANRQNSDFATRQLIADPGYPARSYTFAPDVNNGFCDVSNSLDEEVGNRFWSVCTDFAGGGRVEGTIPGKVIVGAHYTYLDFGGEQTLDVIDEYLHQVGGDVGRARIGGVWDLFIGASGLFRNPNLRGTDVEEFAYNGQAVYLQNTFVIKTTTLLVEAKHYRDYLMAFSQNSLLQYTENPTLEREDQQVPGAQNATGGRVRLDHTWRDIGLTAFASTLEYLFAENVGDSHFEFEADGAFPSPGRLATHNYGGIIWRKPKSDFVLQVSGGYRYERFIDPGAPVGEPAGSPMRRRFPHGEFYLTIPVGMTRNMTHALSVRGEGRWENFAPSAATQENFFRGLFTFGYSLSPWFSITYVQGIDTELPVPQGEPSLTREECAAGQASTCRPHLWPGAQLQVNFFNSSFIRVFAGRQVGGRVCVNGSCRTLPDFEGVRSELVFSF